MLRASSSLGLSMRALLAPSWSGSSLVLILSTFYHPRHCPHSGYIGLILIVFEAGLSSQPHLLFRHLLLSLTVAITGIVLPIGGSLLLLHFAYQYSWLQAFAAGAALCSTSLGTTLALLDRRLRETRVGVVLMSAALLDDIAGLVMASIISQLASKNPGSSIGWRTIVRPVLVSFSFAFGTPLAALLLARSTKHRFCARLGHLLSGPVQLSIIVTTLSGFVSGARYAGTSDLFGAYLAGVFLMQVLSGPFPQIGADRQLPQTFLTTFTTYLAPLLTSFFSPIFFASIGTALPTHSLGSVNGSHRVIWKGLIYALLMAAAKAVVGFWVVVWPDRTNVTR